MTRLLALTGVLAALALGACSDEAESPAPQTSGDTGPAGEDAEARSDAREKARAKAKQRQRERQRQGTEIAVGDSQFGEIVFDGSNQAIYLFDKESTSRAECYGECAAAWPPVLTKGEPVAGDGARQRLLGTTERDDGSTQVTYAGRPLYYYAHEEPGQVLCHNVSEFGGLWLVLDAAGEPLA